MLTHTYLCDERRHRPYGHTVAGTAELLYQALGGWMMSVLKLT